jgi:hypothetical protein
MNCKATLYDDSKNKEIKSEIISKETYLLCENEIVKRNNKIKYPKKWKITQVNI